MGRGRQDYRGRLRTPAAQRLANRSGGSCRQRILALPYFATRFGDHKRRAWLVFGLRLTGLKRLLAFMHCSCTVIA